MIYLFHGSDVEKTRTKAFEWVEKARAKEPGLHYVRLAREETTPSALEEVALSGGLFVKRLLILLDDPFPLKRGGGEENEGEGEGEGEEVDTGSVLEEKLELLASSDNAIVVLAPKLSAARAKKLEAKATKAYKFDLSDARLPAGKQGFNISLVNALAAKDAKKLWLEVARALRSGDAPEMLHGLLHWKARNLMEEGGREWNAREARDLSLRLIALVQDSRRSGADLSESLERFALSI